MFILLFQRSSCRGLHSPTCGLTRFRKVLLQLVIWQHLASLIRVCQLDFVAQSVFSVFETVKLPGVRLEIKQARLLVLSFLGVD